MRLDRSADPAWRRPRGAPARRQPEPEPPGPADLRSLLERRVVEAPTSVLEALRDLLGEVIEAAERAALAAERASAGAAPGPEVAPTPISPSHDGVDASVSSVLPLAGAPAPPDGAAAREAVDDEDRLRMRVAALSRDLASSEAEVERLRDELDRLLVAGMKGSPALRTGILGTAGQRKKKLSMLNRIVDDNLRLRENRKADGSDPA